MQDNFEEISPEEFKKAQKSYMNSREGFISNLQKSFKGRAGEVASLGKESTQLPYPGSFGGQLGQILGRTAVDVPAISVASAFGAPGMAALMGYGYLTSPGETSADKLESGLMTAAPLAGKRAAPYLKNSAQSFKNPMESLSKISSVDKLKNMIETIRKPEKIQQEIDSLKTQKENEGLSKEQVSEDLLGKAEDIFSEKEKSVGQLEKQMDDLFGEKRKESLRYGVQESVKKLNEDLSEQNNKNYTDFDKNFGESSIKSPLDMETLGRDFGIDENIIKKYPEMGDILKRLTPSKTVSKLLGQNQESSHTVGDYLDLYRALRDVVSDNRNQSKRAIGQEKTNLLADAKKMASLRDEIKERKLNSLPEIGKKMFNEAQNFHKDYMAKLREHNPTTSILEEGKVPDNYLDTLNQPGMTQIRDKLFSSPESQQAIALHSMMKNNFSSMTPNKIMDFLQGESGQLLNDDLADTLANYAGHKHDLDYLKKLKTEATKSRVKEPDMAMKELLKEHPELESPFKDLKDMQKRMRDLQKELIQKGLDKKEANDASSKYWKVVSTVKTIKKAKSSLKRIFGG